MEKHSFSIKLKNRLTDLDKIKKAVLQLSSSVDCPSRKFTEVQLILEELFTNVVNHGFSDDDEHDITLSLSCDEQLLKIRMEDNGKPFDLTAAASPDTKCKLENRFIGGLGIHFVKHFADKCTYRRKHGKNITELIKYIKNSEHIISSHCAYKKNKDTIHGN